MLAKMVLRYRRFTIKTRQQNSPRQSQVALIGASHASLTTLRSLETEWLMRKQDLNKDSYRIKFFVEILVSSHVKGAKDLRQR